MLLSTCIDRTSIQKNPESSCGMLAEVQGHVRLLDQYYPNFDHWFSSKVIPGLYSSDRSILVEYRSGALAGIAIVKNTVDEQKICCLRIMPGFENYGIGVRLFSRSFDVLSNEKPLLSVSEESAPKFERIFKYFGFSQTKKYFGLYRTHKLEMSFNGLLLPASTHTKQEAASLTI